MNTQTAHKIRTVKLRHGPTELILCAAVDFSTEAVRLAGCRKGIFIFA